MTATLQNCYELFLQDAARLYQLKLNKIRAYRYELEAAAQCDSFRVALDEITWADFENWIARPPTSSSTIARRRRSAAFSLGPLARTTSA